MRMRLWCALLFVPFAVGCAASVQVAPRPPTAIETSNQIVTAHEETSEPELFRRAERELLDGDYIGARRDFELLLAAGPSPKLHPTILFELGNACEGLGARDCARDAYHAVAEKFPDSPLVRPALLHAIWIHAFLEEWKELGTTASALLARADLDPLSKMSALGARGLAAIEQGDDKPAFRDVTDGIEMMEETHLGAAGRLPPAGAQLKFALAEIRRVRTERIALQPVGDDFVMKVSMRCQGLLEAQSAYGDAMRSEDPHWATMSGYRLGAMYRQLHRELMTIPPDGFAKNERQRQIFYGIMHVRYRALLDKALIMLNTTLDVATKTNDTSSAVARGREAKVEMEQALADEKVVLTKLPFTEGEIERAIQIMQEKAEKMNRP